VRSIVDRFLEHSRIFYFENACQPEVFVGSADWMPRNFFGRIEVVFPIEDGNLRERISSELLALTLADNTKARLLRADGSYHIPPLKRGVIPHRSQMEFITRAGGQPQTPILGKKTKPTYPRVILASRPLDDRIA
jgi:polyphosphate kinase